MDAKPPTCASNPLPLWPSPNAYEGDGPRSVSRIDSVPGRWHAGAKEWRQKTSAAALGNICDYRSPGHSPESQGFGGKVICGNLGQGTRWGH